MNSIDPPKLLGSQWTARLPLDREKHFVVREVIPSRRKVSLEALSSGRRFEVAWSEFEDDAVWLAGWH